MAYYATPESNSTTFSPRPIRLAWIGEAYQFVSIQMGNWALTMLLALVVEIAVGLFEKYFVKRTTPITLAGAYHPDYAHLAIELVISIIVGSFLAAGLYKMALNNVRGRYIQPGDLFSGGSTTLPMIALSASIAIPSSIIATASAALLAARYPMVGLPSTYLYLGSYLAIYIAVHMLLFVLLAPGAVLIADGEPFGTAVGRSLRGMAPVLLPGVLLGILVYILVALSALACLLGLLVTVPMVHVLAVIAARERLGLPTTDTSVPAPAFAATSGAWPPPPSAEPYVPPKSWHTPSAPEPPADPEETIGRASDPPPAGE